MIIPTRYPVVMTVQDETTNVSAPRTTRPQGHISLTTNQVAHHAPGLSYLRTDGTYITAIPHSELVNITMTKESIYLYQYISTPVEIADGSRVYLDGILTTDISSIPLSSDEGDDDTTYVVVTPGPTAVALDNKVNKEPGKSLSSNDYTDEDKSKVSGIEAGAQVNLISVDNLTSDSTTRPLSANQGKILRGLIDGINTLLQSDDTTLDELQEIVEFIKLNREDLDSLGISSIAGLEDALAGKQPLNSILTGTTASFTSALKTKLDAITTGATKNATDAQLRNRSTHTGIQAINTIDGLQDALDDKADIVDATDSVSGLMSPTQFRKLRDIESEATKNATDAQLRDRSTHTGTQAIDTIESLRAELDDRPTWDEVEQLIATKLNLTLQDAFGNDIGFILPIE